MDVRLNPSLRRVKLFFCTTFAIASASLLPVGALANVTISTNPTSNMNCVAGTCAPTGPEAVLNVVELEGMLTSGNVTVTTAGAGGVEAGDLLIRAFLQWADQTTLHLSAYHSVAVARVVNIMGAGGITISTNAGGSGGSLSFAKLGRIAFHHRAAQLTIDDSSYVLAENLSSLAKAITRNPNGHYALAHDYDASADGNYQLSPIAPEFFGTFQGLGNAIVNLTIHDKGNGTGDVGLFSLVGPGGVVSNLRLVNVDILVLKGAREGYVGGIASGSGGLLQGDRVSGRIEAIHATAGGLVGDLGDQAMVVGSTADVDVRAAVAGGLVGNCFSCFIVRSSAAGPVEASKVRRYINVAGGLIGGGGTSIDQCFATGRVTGGLGAYIGGLQGYGGSSVSNSYALGELRVVAGTNAGGLIGTARGTTSTSYAANGVLSGTTTAFGGFASEIPQPVNTVNDYWNTDTSGTQQGTAAGNRPGVTGLTTEQLTAGLPSGFDSAIWGQSPAINHGLPYLLANPPH